MNYNYVRDTRDRKDDDLFLEVRMKEKMKGFPFNSIEGRELFTGDVTVDRHRYYPKSEGALDKVLRLHLAKQIQNMGDAIIKEMGKAGVVLNGALDDYHGGPNKDINGDITVTMEADTPYKKNPRKYKKKTNGDKERIIRSLHRRLNVRIREVLEKKEDRYKYFTHNSQRPVWTRTIKYHAFIELPGVIEELVTDLSKKRGIGTRKLLHSGHDTALDRILEALNL